VKMFDAGKTRMIKLSYGEKNCDDMFSRFHLIPERNGRTGRQMDRFDISIPRVSMLTHDKKTIKNITLFRLQPARDSRSPRYLA